MKENDVRNMDLTSRKAGEGSGEDERLLMMLGEALGVMVTVHTTTDVHGRTRSA